MFLSRSKTRSVRSHFLRFCSLRLCSALLCSPPPSHTPPCLHHSYLLLLPDCLSFAIFFVFLLLFVAASRSASRLLSSSACFGSTPEKTRSTLSLLFRFVSWRSLHFPAMNNRPVSLCSALPTFSNFVVCMYFLLSHTTPQLSTTQMFLSALSPLTFCIVFPPHVCDSFFWFVFVIACSRSAPTPFHFIFTRCFLSFSAPTPPPPPPPPHPHGPSVHRL